MKLKTWLKMNNVTQRQASEALGISKGYFSEIVTGKKRPNPDLARKIERFTGGHITTMDLIYPGRDPEPDEDVPRGTPLTWDTRKDLLEA
ncbi:MAG TPA: XRE family transcriptional regulator [Deltaproteobacteria bacterium]|nr:XRE family transcriptional regulator [Deltaproteobacteria bacterium]